MELLKCCFLVRRGKESLFTLVAVPVHEREGDGEVAEIVQTQVAVCCIYVGLTTFGIVFIVISFIQLYEKKTNETWPVKIKVCCGGRICFLNKHELQLSD